MYLLGVEAVIGDVGLAVAIWVVLSVDATVGKLFSGVHVDVEVDFTSVLRALLVDSTVVVLGEEVNVTIGGVDGGSNSKSQ